jgi:tetratricopeptide (TPR) repeat protein
MPRKLLLLYILAAVCLSAYAAEQPPIEVSSPHFTLVTDAGEKQARHVLDNFERMRWMFQTLFPKTNVDPSAPIIVFAARNKKEFQAPEPAEYLVKGQLNLAGYFLTSTEKNLILLRLDPEFEHPFATVYHEYTHLQFRDAGAWMPLWLNEGIAEFFQNTDFHDKEVILGQPSADDILYLRQNQTIPLDVLFRVDHNSPYYHEENKGSVFYSESWALTHYIQVTDRENKTHRLDDYMIGMSRHEDPVTAAQKAFGDLKQLQKQLGSYIQQQQYKQFVLSSAAAPIDPASYKVRVLTQPEYDADRADFLAYVGRTQEARTLLDSVMKAAPKNAQSRETMGYLEFRAGDREAARKWFGEAVELNSQSYLASYYFASMSMSSADAAQDQRIELSLRNSIRLNPSFAPAYDQLAGWYMMKHDKRDEALGLEQKAVQLDRSNISYRINTANLLMMSDKFDTADQVLIAAQKLARSSQDSTMIANRRQELASIQKMRSTASDSSPNSSIVTFDTVNEPSGGGQVQTSLKVIADDPTPKHPIEPPTGSKHTALGVLDAVQCSYPSYMELQVKVTGKLRPVTLYTNNFSKLDLSALGFTPKSTMDPCHELGGMKAKVVYAESSDKTIDGQLVSIELHK